MFDLKNGETFNSDANVPLLQNAAGDNEVNAELVSPIPPMNSSSPLTNLFSQPSLRSSIFALICVTLGTGMLPLPYFFKTNGVVLTMVMYAFCGIATYLTLKILINMAYLNNTYSYNDLVAKYYGKKMVLLSHGMFIYINSLRIFYSISHRI